MTTGTDFHVGIVGLGSMGMGAARSCLRAGLSTWGADLNPQACANLLAEGACGAAASAREFAGVVDALVILVVNAAQVRQVLFGEDGAAHLMKPGSAVMVSSTISSADAQEIAAALTALNLNMLDAPVSGGAVKAAQGEMTVMASGSEAAFTRLKPVLEAVAATFIASAIRRAQVQPSKSFINCWLACILRRRPKRWRWPRGPVFLWT